MIERGSSSAKEGVVHCTDEDLRNALLIPLSSVFSCSLPYKGLRICLVPLCVLMSVSQMVCGK